MLGARVSGRGLAAGSDRVVLWPGLRRAGLPRQSPAQEPGQRRAERVTLMTWPDASGFIPRIFRD